MPRMLTTLRGLSRWVVPLALGCSAPALAADPPHLAAFMARWRAPPPGEYPMDAAELPLIVSALARDPSGPWADDLTVQAAEARLQLRSLRGHARQERAAQLAPFLEQAVAILGQATAASSKDRGVAQLGKELRVNLCFWQLEAGSQPAPAILADAQRLLQENHDPGAWDYGNVVYRANELSGRAALREHHLDEARRFLRAAGRAPPSPQLSSSGPDYVLARELLEAGGPPERATVQEFLGDVERLFRPTAPRGEANAQAVSAARLAEIALWREAIRSGKVPDSPTWY